MHPKIAVRALVILLACLLVSGCKSSFRLLLYNDSEETIIVHRRADDPFPLAIYPGVTGEFTAVSLDAFTIERKGHVLHFNFPRAYLHPSPEVSSAYQHKVPKIGECYYFKMETDTRIYILRKRDRLESRVHPEQPAGFPLVPG